MKKLKKFLSLLLALTMVLGMVNLSAFAAEEGETETSPKTYCGKEEHTHTDACYELTCGKEVGEGAVEAKACTYVHEHNETCGYAEAKAEVPCDKSCENEHVAECAYKAAVEEQPCTDSHEHNDACGYAEAVEGHTHTIEGGCYKLTCTTEEHTHSEECYEAGTSGGEQEPEGAVKIGNTGYETLQKAIDAAQSGDTITLLEDFTATGNETCEWGTWLYQMYAAKTHELTIDLNNHVVDCGNKYGWIHVNSGNESGVSLTVKNGTIQNAAACSQGSAIWAWEKLTLENVTIKNCKSANYGGAVYVGSSDETTNVAVTYCTFEGNKSGYGGGIYIAMAQKVDISNTTFSKNVAIDEYGFGGAFYVDHGPSTVTLNACEFNGNKAPYGGAISTYDNCKLVITDCQLNKNTATVGGGAINAGGNSMAGKLGEFMITDTSFTDNTAQYGGAIYGTYLNPSKLENVTFNRNNATGAYGGAVYCYDASMTIDNVKATSNTSGNCGGGFFLNHAPATITDSTIMYNTAPYGGGLYCSQSAVTISSSTITDNTAVCGGGIASYFDNLTLEVGAEVHNNAATSWGDDIYSSDAGYHETYPASLKLVIPENVKLKSDGKDIAGWFIDGQEGETTTTKRWSAEGFYKEFDGENSVVALKAAHGAYYTVTYTDGVDDQDIFADQVFEVKDGSATPAFDGTPTRSGYTFTGWTLDGAAYDFTKPVTGDITLVAQWSRNYVPSPSIPDTNPPTTDIPDENPPLANVDDRLNVTDHFAYVIGYPDGEVKPEQNITRAEAVTIFYRLMIDSYRTENWSTTNSYSDVDASAWYNCAISTATKAGIFKGDAEGTARPDDPITRAEFAALAARFISDKITDDGVGDFSDTKDHWAAKEIRLAAKAGWITGVGGGKFEPERYINRAEVMTLVNRMLDRVADKDHMLPDMKKWPDNMDTSAWYYEAVQEATNDHDYEPIEGTLTEQWTKMKAPKDWITLEKGWIANNGANPETGK